MEKKRIMLMVDNVTEFVCGMLYAVVGLFAGEAALDKIHEGNPVGWAVFAVAGSCLAIVLIRKILEKRLAGTGEAVE